MANRSIAFLLGLMSFGLSAGAAGPGITRVDGASNSVLLGSTDVTTIEIYGGLAGPSCGSGTGLCTNCGSAYQNATDCSDASLKLCVCNEARINNNTELTLTLTRPEGVAAGAQAYLLKGEDSEIGTSIARTRTNDGSSVTVKWSKICNVIAGGTGGADTDCESLFTAGKTVSTTLRVFIDADGDTNRDAEEEATSFQVYLSKPDDDDAIYNIDRSKVGIESFIPYPGDGKIYLESIEAVEGFPQSLSHGIRANRLRVFIADTSLDDANFEPGAISPATLTYDNDGNLENNEVDGLQNGVLYVFRTGIVDMAGNVVQYYPSNSGGTSPADSTCYTFDNNTPTSCEVAAIPDEVLGLLSEDINCFVATAAYGTTFNQKLKTFRDFRHQILLRHSWGQKLVKAYYHYGPYAARWISQSPSLRALARGALWPAYGFSLLALKFGVLPALLMSLLLTIASFFALKYTYKRMLQRA